MRVVKVSEMTKEEKYSQGDIFENGSNLYMLCQVGVGKGALISLRGDRGNRFSGVVKVEKGMNNVSHDELSLMAGSMSKLIFRDDITRITVK